MVMQMTKAIILGLMNRVNLKDIEHIFPSCEIVINKSGRIALGVNQGRMVYKGDGVYYKIFDKGYCRVTNFVKALEAGFFDEVAPALQSLIEDDGEIVGYIMEAGEMIDKIPIDFYQRVLSLVEEKKMFFYDLVSINIIKAKSGEISLIDLESVYDLDELYTISKHNAVVKPDYYFAELERLWKKNMKKISFIQPSRNNLKYLKWSYDSIRKNLGSEHEICWADDFSNDGTWEWMQEIAEKDKNVKIHRNEGPTRLGHTILYDTLINDYATNDIVMIYHADMYALPGLDEEVNKYIGDGKVVSLTRIEPPLHPPGPEKILEDYGIEPEEFNEQKLLNEYQSFKRNKTTEGIFAPWAIMKSDFQSIGGHDPLYAPQSKEDSDIFNRFVLAGYELIQTWDGFVYHMTCRGSRFADGAKRNPNGEVFMKNRETDEWLKQNHRSTRNFIRKWGHFVKHDSLLKPIVPPKYDIGFIVKNCSYDLLYELEPWCSTIYTDYAWEGYIRQEQDNTLFDLKDRVKPYDNEKNNDILIEFDAKDFQMKHMNIISQLSEILAVDDELETGEHELQIFKITINKLKTYEEDLIKCTR